MGQRHFPKFLKNVFLITLEMHCLLVHSNYLQKKIQLLCVLGPLSWIFVVRFHKILKKSYIYVLFLFVIVTYFCYVTVMLFICSKEFVFDDVGMTLNYGNYWNV